MREYGPGARSDPRPLTFMVILLIYRHGSKDETYEVPEGQYEEPPFFNGGFFEVVREMWVAEVAARSLRQLWFLQRPGSAQCPR